LDLDLNTLKTAIVLPSCDGNKLLDELLLLDIGRLVLEGNFFGGAVNQYKGFIEELLINIKSCQDC
jgi:hypothetical protein